MNLFKELQNRGKKKVQLNYDQSLTFVSANWKKSNNVLFSVASTLFELGHSSVVDKKDLTIHT